MISKGREYLVTNELRRQKECLRLKDTKKHNKCDDQIQKKNQKRTSLEPLEKPEYG